MRDTEAVRRVHGERFRTIGGRRGAICIYPGLEAFLRSTTFRRVMQVGGRATAVVMQGKVAGEVTTRFLQALHEWLVIARSCTMHVHRPSMYNLSSRMVVVQT